MAFCHRLLVSLVAMATIGCQSDQIDIAKPADSIEFNSASENSTENLANIKLEKMNVLVSSSNLQLKVVSNGCTNAEHFLIAKEPPGQCRFAVVRSQPDFCKRASSIANIAIQWRQPEGCSLDEIVFVNPSLTE